MKKEKIKKYTFSTLSKEDKLKIQKKSDYLDYQFGYDADLFFGELEKLCEELREKYKNDETFIEAIVVCGNDDAYGWALHKIKDKKFVKYAKEYMINDLREFYGDDEERFKFVLSSKKIPLDYSKF